MLTCLRLTERGMFQGRWVRIPARIIFSDKKFDTHPLTHTAHTGIWAQHFSTAKLYQHSYYVVYIKPQTGETDIFFSVTY